MGIKEYIPGTKARQDRQQELVDAEWERAEAEKNEIIQQTRENWIARKGEYYEEERAALERILAYKAALIDAKEPEDVGGRQFRFTVVEDEDHSTTACFVQRDGITDVNLHIIHTKWPLERVAMRMRPVRMPDILATNAVRTHNPTQDREHPINKVIKSQVLGYQVDVRTTNLLGSATSTEDHVDLSDMAETLEEFFGPLPDDQPV